MGRYYKVGHALLRNKSTSRYCKVGQFLLQNGAIVVTEWSRYYKVRQLYYLVGKLLETETIIITKNYKFMLLQNEVILTHFQTNVLLLYSLKTSENFRFSGFLTFSGDIEVEHWLKMGLFYKMGQVIYCKMGRSLSQSGAGITKWTTSLQNEAGIR